MTLVISLTFALSCLALCAMYLSYFPTSLLVKNTAKIAAVSFLMLYLSVWLSSHDELNLKPDSVHTASYRVFQSRAELMKTYYGISGSPSENDESGCFFFITNGKVVPVHLSSFGLYDYRIITPMTQYVIEDVSLVGKNPWYFHVCIPKHSEYLETIDYHLGVTKRIFFRSGY